MSYSNSNLSAKYSGVLAVSMLDANSDPIAWRAAMVTEIKSFAPSVASEIETGINEIDALIDPVFEDISKRGRRAGTNDPAVFNSLSLIDQALPLLHDPPPANLFINWSDSKFFYSIQRREGYIGDSGKSKYDSELRINQQMRTAFKKE